MLLLHCIIFSLHSIDENLKNWCASITDRNINNNFQSGVRSPLKVYCGDYNDTSYKYYNETEVSYVATQIEADSDRCPSPMYKNSLYQLWMQHPDIRHTCCYAGSDLDYHISLMSQLFLFDVDFYSLIGGLKSTVAIGLREELVKLCSSGSTDPFCPIKAALDTIDVALRLPADKSTWTLTTETYHRAVVISFAILGKKFPTEYSVFSNINLDLIIVESTNIILKHIHNKEISQLMTYASYLPPSDAYLPATATCGTDRLCIFMKTVEQVRLYLDEAKRDTDPILVNGKKRLILNTAVDYREFLEQKQLDQTLTVLAEQSLTARQIANDIKEHTATRFTEIKAHFRKVQTFSQTIASADIGHVNEKLDHYTESIRTIAGVLKNDMAFVLTKVFASVGVNVTENIVYGAMEIAEGVNPLKQLTSDVDAILRGTDHLFQLSASMAEFVELDSISLSLNQLIFKTIEIATKIQLNSDFFLNIHYLIMRETVTKEQFEASKSSFADQYTMFTPQFMKSELVELGTIWETLIDSTCNVVDGSDSATRSVVNDGQYCITLKPQSAKMISLFKEIYDYQFELIDAMAAYVRSSIIVDAAKMINAEFIGILNDTNLDTLDIFAGLSYVSYKVHILHAVNLYCNVLEYMDGGKQPSECKGVYTDVPLLIASMQSVCRSESTYFYKIPTKPSSDSDKAYIDIAKLFSGHEVSFKVPSSDWLVAKDWIRAGEKSSSFYVKKFEVFLPAKPDYPTKFKTMATPVLHNEVIPGSTEYIIVPNMPLVNEYSMGPSRLRCLSPKFSNPYTSCETSAVSQICEHSHSIKHHLYPSIYSQWKLSIKGGEELVVPDPATDLYVLAGIQLCKIASSDYIEYQSVTAMEEVDQCCPAGEYRPDMKSACVSCPANSLSALAGFYCEKDYSY